MWTERIQIRFCECCVFQVLIFHLMLSVYRDTHAHWDLSGLTHLLWSARATMIIGYLVCLWFFAACRATRPPQRGAFAPVQDDSDTPNLIEGDIALPPNVQGSGSALNTFLKTTRALWPRGRVPYRIDTDEWEVGIQEPVFLDS